MKLQSKVWVLAALMCVVSIAGVTAAPSVKTPPPDLEAMVPKAFGKWTELPDQVIQVIDPQTKKAVDDIYDVLLSRTYVNSDGYRIMLSMAYGSDQRGVKQAHRPEICYPAQGFKVDTVQDGPLPTASGDIKVRRLTANMGTRSEPVTYWLTVGDRVIRNQIEKRVVEFVMGVTGQIPAGLLYRVSSIDKDPERAFAMQQKFVADMMAAVPAETRRRLSGLAAAPGAS